MGNKIAIFAFESREINTYPSIINTINILSKNGYFIDLYIPNLMKSDSIVIKNLDIIVIDTNDKYSYITITFNRIYYSNIDYKFFISCYYEGLMVASLINKIKPVPVIYFSLEIIYKNYNLTLLKNLINPKYFLPAIIGKLYSLIKKNKNSEYYNNLFVKCHYLFKYYFLGISIWNYLKFNKNDLIKFSIVQDKNRATLLQKEFGLNTKIIIVPNSYIGFSNESSLFAYDKFKIPFNKKILLFTGGLERGFDLNLIKMLDLLTDEYLLFLNCYSRDGYIEEITPMLSKYIKNGKLYINDTILDENDYDLLVKSSYVGIPWYSKFSEKNENMYYLGLSSGKLTKFLSIGKPVIAPSYFFDYYNLIEGNGMGYVCENAYLIPGCLRKIAFNYDIIVNNIKNHYLKEIEFETKFKVVLDEIKLLA